MISDKSRHKDITGQDLLDGPLALRYEILSLVAQDYQALVGNPTKPRLSSLDEIPETENYSGDCWPKWSQIRIKRSATLATYLHECWHLCQYYDQVDGHGRSKRLRQPMARHKLEYCDRPEEIEAFGYVHLHDLIMAGLDDIRPGDAYRAGVYVVSEHWRARYPRSLRKRINKTTREAA